MELGRSRNASSRSMVWMALLVLAALTPVAAWAQEKPQAQSQTQSREYVIGNDDVLQVSVFLRPELERTVTVNNQGNIVYPPLGELKAAGLTTRQLSDRLADRLSSYLRTTATVTVTVKEYLSRGVQVTGAVVRPGRYGAEEMPGLLDVINQAGGPLTDADLSRVVVVRREPGGQKQFPADLAEALQTGSEKGLPALRPGDIILVPSRSAASGTINTHDSAGILGEVSRPGLYPVSEGQDLWVALAQAGGPTGRADLGDVHVLSKDQDVRNAVTVNLKETLSRGYKTPFMIRPGDIVFVDAKGIGFWAGFSSVLAVTTDIANLILLVEVLKSEN
jgi:polysaccharide export outer membrane protein